MFDEIEDANAVRDAVILAAHRARTAATERMAAEFHDEVAALVRAGDAALRRRRAARREP